MTKVATFALLTALEASVAAAGIRPEPEAAPAAVAVQTGCEGSEHGESFDMAGCVYIGDLRSGPAGLTWRLPELESLTELRFRWALMDCGAGGYLDWNVYVLDPMAETSSEVCGGRFWTDPGKLKTGGVVNVLRDPGGAGCVGAITGAYEAVYLRVSGSLVSGSQCDGLLILPGMASR